MRKARFITASVLAATSILGGAALAVAEGVSRDGGKPDRAERVERMFEAFDANEDGALSRAEIEMGRFLRADGDGDGVVSEAELTAALVKRSEQRAKRIFARLDGDGNGVVEQAEYDERAKPRRRGRMFERLDANNDGLLTRHELARKRRAAD